MRSPGLSPRALVVTLASTTLIAASSTTTRADDAPSSGPARTQQESTDTHPELAIGIIAGVYGALYLYTYLAWYRGSESTPSLRFRDEGWLGRHTYAGGADKLGHLWANQALTRAGSGILQWGGYDRTWSLAASTALTVAFFTVVEIKDGCVPRYGFAWTDIAFNLLGNAAGSAFELLPELDAAIDLRIGYWPSPAFIAQVETQGPWNSAEDYTGQRFFLSYHLASIELLRASPHFAWTEWFDLTLGYRALHYKPETMGTPAPVQELFAGISLNLQHVVDRALGPPARSGRPPGTGVRALRFGLEVIAVPFTTLVPGRPTTFR